MIQSILRFFKKSEPIVCAGGAFSFAPDSNSVHVYSDASWNQNSQTGGIGIVFYDPDSDTTAIYSEYIHCSDSNAAEMMAVIIGIKSIAKKCDITIHTDSSYVIDGFSTLEDFRNDEWISPKGKMKNVELHQELYRVSKGRKIEMKWTHDSNDHVKTAHIVSRQASQDRMEPSIVGSCIVRKGSKKRKRRKSH